jgi:acyl carrier protein
MTIEEFINKIESEIEEFPPGTLKPDTNPRELEQWSSMHALILIALIDSEYNVTISGEELIKCLTVNDLYNLVQSKLS